MNYTNLFTTSMSPEFSLVIIDSEMYFRPYQKSMHTSICPYPLSGQPLGFLKKTDTLK